MSKTYHISFVILFFVLFSRSSFAQDSTSIVQSPKIAVLTSENGYEGNPKEMMKNYLFDRITKKRNIWYESYEKLKTPEEIEAYQKERKTKFQDRLGKFWDRNTPFNPKITKTLQAGTSGKSAYRVEMVVFESVPNFFVSGAVFIPDETRFKPPYPAVLVVCGHSNQGKAFELYQRVPALAASNGLLAMSIDPIDQGERSQRLTPEGKPAAQSVPAHNIIGSGSILLGRNAATFEVWDMMRAIDYLQSRSDVVKDKIGVTGTSGGGTQTSYIMSLDDRVAAAVPSCYLCGLFDSMLRQIGPQDAEQNIFGQLEFGMDHADYCIIRAPKPTLIETVTEDFFPAPDAWTTYRNVKRIYDKFGYADRISLIESEGKHGWHKNLREASIRWMLRWLDARDEAVFEADDMPIFKTEEFCATPNGEVLLLDGARSAFDLNRDYNDELLVARKMKNANRTREELADVVRKTIGVRPIGDIPAYEVERMGDVDLKKFPFADLIFKAEKFVLKTADGKIHIPVVKYFPKTESTGLAILLSEDNQLDSYLEQGKTVATVDLRGLGETQAICSQYFQHKMFGTDGQDFYLAYLLGKTYVGMRTEDLLATACWLKSDATEQKIGLVASGDVVGLVALHATVLEPSLFDSVKLDKTPRSWYDVVKEGSSYYPITNLVHGALLEYDVPDLMKFIPFSK